MVKKIKKEVNKKVRVNEKVKQNNNKNLVLYGLGAIVIIAALVIGLTGFPTNATGATITVTSYGLSDKLMSTHAGKIQTLIEFTKPQLKSLSTPEGRASLVPGIVNKIDFKNEIVKAYKNNPWATISTTSLNMVAVGAMNEANNFDTNTRCFKEIGSGYRRFPDLKLVVISELKYQSCRNIKDWHYGYMQHTFYQQNGNKFICMQDNNKLFAVDDKNGDVSLDTTQC